MNSMESSLIDASKFVGRNKSDIQLPIINTTIHVSIRNPSQSTTSTPLYFTSFDRARPALSKTNPFIRTTQSQSIMLEAKLIIQLSLDKI